MMKKRQTGLTAIEMLIVLAIAGILLAVGLPGFQATVARMTTNSQAKILLSSLNLARSEAIKRHSVVAVCGSNNGVDCAAGAWNAGWLVFADNNADADGAAGSVDPGDVVLRVYTELGSGSSLSYPSAVLRYDSQGFGLNIPTTPLQRFLICPASGIGEYAQAIDISITGRGARNNTGLVCP
ncbi:MAG: GspH/FimT family pseudopilin [Pseudomonadales bacterium]|nr:GspH/FimT family pseudopilin [Pseudomonadales bacterium]